MGINLAKITDFFGLADDDDMYHHEVAAPAAPAQKKKQVSRPKKSAPAKKERMKVRPTYQKQVAPQKQQPVMPQRQAQSVVEPQLTNRRSDVIKQKVETTPVTKNEKVVAMPNNNRSQRFTPKTETKNKDRISVIEPKSYSEATSIAKRVGQGEVVLINFESLDEMKARRMVDFLTGVVFMIDGDIKRVGNEMFLCTPTNYEINNSSLSTMVDEDIYGLGM